MSEQTDTIPDPGVLTPPEYERLVQLRPWQASAICVLLFSLLGPLVVLPWWMADRVVPVDPLLRPTVAGLIGTALAIVSFLVLARTLGIPAQAIFLRVPTARTLRWFAFGTILATTLTVGTVATTDGTVLWGPERTIVLGGHLLAGLSLGLWTGTIEELVLRGAVLSIVGHQWNWLGAVLVTAAIFGAMHNAGADSAIGTGLYVGLTGIAGVFFALITLATGNVWNAVAVHASWNTVFSERVLVLGSPREVTAIATYEIRDGSWLVGGGYATPVESPLAIVLFLGTTVAFAFVCLRRG